MLLLRGIIFISRNKLQNILRKILERRILTYFWHSTASPGCLARLLRSLCLTLLCARPNTCTLDFLSGCAQLLREREHLETSGCRADKPDMLAARRLQGRQRCGPLHVRWESRRLARPASGRQPDLELFQLIKVIESSNTSNPVKMD